MLTSLPFRGILDREFRIFLNREFSEQYAKPFYKILYDFPEHFEVYRCEGCYGLASYLIEWKLFDGTKKPVTFSVLFDIFDYYGYYDLL